jgi:hypothetical protein
MASVNKLVAQSGGISGASGQTSAVSLESLTENFIPTVQVSAIGAGTALAVKLQHSPDGTYWKDAATLENVSGGTSLNAVGILLKELAATVPLYGNVRFTWTLTGGTTTATAIFSVYYDKKR